MEKRMNKTYVIGDIHGAYEGLLQCMGKSGFDYASDRLICLGDVCDRRARVKECVDELLKVRNLVMIMGNHDRWALDWMEGGETEGIWLQQGGSDTVNSYRDGVPEEHILLFRKASYYYIANKKLFVHGGIDYRHPIEDQQQEDFIWDRSLVSRALELKDMPEKLTEYDEVFVGHTPTLNLPAGDQAGRYRSVPRSRFEDPVRLCNVWLMDTGAGWEGGRLSMMEVQTKEVFQSDRLY
ncbi:MAG: metallophosphoesterase [Bacteroidales bacterium]